jgi:dTDP-4-dehydrorhamnose 3,5-epimerase-like enzyme
LWNDPTLNIDWELFEAPILSDKDKLGTSFADFETPFL